MHSYVHSSTIHNSQGISSVQLLSSVWFFTTPWTVAHQAFLSITNSRSLFKLMSIESVMLSSHLILSSPSPPAFNLSQHQDLFKWVSSLNQSGGQSIGVSASASVLPMTIQDWFPLGWTSWFCLQSKGLKSLLQYHSSRMLFFKKWFELHSENPS